LHQLSCTRFSIHLCLHTISKTISEKFKPMKRGLC
jgi:hypothetical protein